METMDVIVMLTASTLDLENITAHARLVTQEMEPSVLVSPKVVAPFKLYLRLLTFIKFLIWLPAFLKSELNCVRFSEATSDFPKISERYREWAKVFRRPLNTSEAI